MIWGFQMETKMVAPKMLDSGISSEFNEQWRSPTQRDWSRHSWAQLRPGLVLQVWPWICWLISWNFRLFRFCVPVLLWFFLFFNIFFMIDIAWHSLQLCDINRMLRDASLQHGEVRIIKLLGNRPPGYRSPRTADYPLVNVYKLRKDQAFSLGKSTISTGPFSVCESLPEGSCHSCAITVMAFPVIWGDRF